MPQVLERTSTASSETFVTRHVRFFGPRVRVIVAYDYRDLGTFSFNNSGRRRPSDLGWSRQQTLETRKKLAALEEDWLVPGMEEYDSL